jgi:hypothetical protein
MNYERTLSSHGYITLKAIHCTTFENKLFAELH